MATDYCSATDIVNRIKIKDNAGDLIVPSPTSDPTLAQLEDLINQTEDEIDDRTQHAWRTKTITSEMHDIINNYQWGRGIPIHLFHRNIKTLTGASGDKLEIWDGSNYDDVIGNSERFNVLEEMGIVYLRGYVFSIFRENRIRITYRYGETVIPNDIKEACIIGTLMRLLESDIAMSNIEYGPDRGIRLERVIERWQDRYDKIIERHGEWIHVEY